MGIAKLYNQGGGNGFEINGIIQDYYVYAGETVEKGDFVKILTGSNGAETEKQVRKATASYIYGVAKTGGTGGDSTGHKDIVSIYTIDTSIKLASLPVGTLVKDPSSTFLGEPVIWKIADINHEGYPSNSVTLISDKILAIRPFDAKEPNNTNEDRKNYGNNRYSVSNIRQWLNSDAEAGQWYLAQHSADAPPNSDNVSQSINPYDTKSGFLNGFSQQFKNALLETNLTVALNTVTDGGGSEILTDKIFLASNTEVGVTNENSIVEGALLPIFSDDASRISYCTTEAIDDSNSTVDPSNDTTPQAWLLRTPRSSVARNVCCVTGAGTFAGSSALAYAGNYGVRPLCNLPSSIRVTQGEGGIYELVF